MKAKISLPKFYFIILSGIFILSSCSSWHYRYPRVSVDTDKTIVNKNSADESTLVTNITPSVIMEEEENVMVANASVPEKMEIKIDRKIYSKFTVKDTEPEMNKATFTQKNNREHKLFKVQEVENTALSGWLRLMIILLAVGLVLIILGAIFSAVLFGGFWWFFYLIGSLCILAAAVILVLGLLGVMH